MQARVEPKFTECIAVKKFFIVAYTFEKAGSGFVYCVSSVIKSLFHRYDKAFFKSSTGKSARLIPESLKSAIGIIAVKSSDASDDFVFDTGNSPVISDDF